MPAIDFAKAGEEGIKILSEVIRTNTVNPPGDELPAALYYQKLFEEVGLKPELFKPSETRANLIVRLQGKGKAGPLILLSHLDVVGVEKEKWKYDPFEAAVDDGFLYGRGAIDDKGMGALFAEIVLLIVRNKIPLKRDILFVACADEEAGGREGICWLIENHRGKIAAEAAINEGGRVKLNNGKVEYVAIQNAEKVPYHVHLKVRGTPGHASVPLPDNAIFRLAKALAKIEEYKTPLKLNDTTRAVFKGVAELDPNSPTGFFARNIEDPLIGAYAREQLARHPYFNSILRNSIAPTIFQSGIRENVLPSEAEATLNCRLLPGENVENFIAELKKVAADETVEISFRQGKASGVGPSPSSNEVFQALSRSATKTWPGAKVFPFMSTGATDSAELRSIGVNCYGILPFPLTEGDEARMHGHDERISLKSFSEGLAFIYCTLEEVAFA
ncbi:MAG TPA: M20/M25/M40 family metallo-hydrolase [candidate division Zixibacteria bacterium]|nr:M20/M25/M40 family metallo-hydrolase [candidate division Zixibacteria bacterium]